MVTQNSEALWIRAIPLIKGTYIPLPLSLTTLTVQLLNNTRFFKQRKRRSTAPRVRKPSTVQTNLDQSPQEQSSPASPPRSPKRGNQLLQEFLSHNDLSQDQRQFFVQLIRRNRFRRRNSSEEALTRREGLLERVLGPFVEKDAFTYEVYQTAAMKREFKKEYGELQPNVHSEFCR
jgi:hypothetical protein